jgi:DNA polymerase I
MSRWLLVDGFNLMYRSFFATPALTRSDGFPTNALHGWVKSLWRMMDQAKANHTVVFFDLGGSRDRLALHPEYKAQRKEMPDELARQIPYVKSLTQALGLATVELNGVESDDLLASCAVQCAARGDDVLIVSSDKDFAQLVTDRIKILVPPPSAQPKLGWRTLDCKGVEEKFGVSPNQIADYLALMGDVSDNIPGLSGVGPKTAAKWLGQYRNLDAILGAADSIEPERFRAALFEARERLRLNLRLTTLNVTLTLPSVTQVAPDLKALTDFLTEMEMKTTLAEARSRYTQPELF